MIINAFPQKNKNKNYEASPISVQTVLAQKCLIHYFQVKKKPHTLDFFKGRSFFQNLSVYIVTN